MPEPSTSLPAAARADAHNLAPLLEGAIAGAPEAMDALLLKLRPYFHSLLRARFGAQFAPGLDHSALVQEGLLRVFKYLQTLQQPTVPHLLAWAKQILVNLAKDAREKENREAKKRLLVFRVDLSTHDSKSGQIRERWGLQLTQALEQLPKRRRLVLEMSFFEKLSDVEIGRRLCGSPGAVRVLRFRALKELRGLLETLSESDDSSRDFCAWQPKQDDHENKCRSGKLE
jgi:RNA polymerase sigma factor (sigma-70 family)